MDNQNSFDIYRQLKNDLKTLYPNAEVLQSKASPQLIQLHFITDRVYLDKLIDKIVSKPLKVITLDIMQYKGGLLITLITK